MSDPLPSMGPWIAPPGDGRYADAAELKLACDFELPEGYPRCFGLCWVAAAPGVQLELNGKPLKPDAELSLDQPGRVGLPWAQLKEGRNTLAAVGSAGDLAKGVSLLGRVHTAFSGWHSIPSGAHWLCHAQGAEPVAVVLEPGHQPAPAPKDNGPRRAVELTRTLELDAVPAQALVYVTGLGCYELFINGQKVGDELLAPGWTDYETRVYYAAHDVTPLLRSGKNTITATLGNAWWSSGMGWESASRPAKSGQPLRLLMDLEICGEDGQMIRQVGTDADWQWRPSPTTHDTIYHGQSTDFTADTGPWKPVALLDGDGLSPLILPHVGEPIRVTQTLSPVKARVLGNGEWLFDFGQNHAGRPRVRGQFPAGTTLRIRYCEELDEQGDPYFENYRTAAVTDRITASDEAIDWTPAFTYRGFRYACVQGLPSGTTPDQGLLTSEVLHNDVRSASEFKCSNELLNQIDHIMRWGVRSNLHSVPTDCPQRDERLGWTGDVQLVAPTSCWLFDLHQFYRKWLIDLMDAQQPDGQVMHVAPYMDVLPIESAPVWADIIAVLPAVLHRFYGDREVLEQCYGPMRRWVDFFASRAKDGLALFGGFGDWVPVEPTPSELCGAAYFAHTSRLVGDIAAKLGHDADAKRYHDQAQLAGHAFHKHFYDESAGHYTPDTQTAQLLPLAFDLTPQPLRQGVADHLAKRVREKGNKPTTGFVGTAFLLPVLSRFGHHELAYQTLNTREYPSLGYMIDQGATTVWERWNSDKEGPDMNSRNHFCLGAMAQWLYEDLAGMKFDDTQAAGRHVQLAPRPVGDITELSFTYQSICGPIETAWSITDGTMRYTVTLPKDMAATLTLPGQKQSTTLSAGEHRMEHPIDLCALPR